MRAFVADFVFSGGSVLLGAALTVREGRVESVGADRGRRALRWTGEGRETRIHDWRRS